MGYMADLIPSLERIEELHRNIAPSQAAYELIHTHCVIVSRIAVMLARHQNALWVRQCSASGAQDGARDGGIYGVQAGEAFGMETGAVHGGRRPMRLLDEHLVMVGGLLHDIGTYRVLAHDGSDGNPLQFDGPRYILHGLLGYEYLLESGIDESVAQFARNHTGIGLTREQVRSQGLPLPEDDYVPVNIEQETVMVADKYHSKSTPPKFLTAQAYERKAAKFGEENAQRWRDVLDQYGVVDVSAMAEEYGMSVRA